MKCQDLFSLKNKNKKLLSAAVVIGAKRVKVLHQCFEDLIFSNSSNGFSLYLV